MNYTRMTLKQLEAKESSISELLKTVPKSRKKDATALRQNLRAIRDQAGQLTEAVANVLDKMDHGYSFSTAISMFSNSWIDPDVLSASVHEVNSNRTLVVL